MPQAQSDSQIWLQSPGVLNVPFEFVISKGSGNDGAGRQQRTRVLTGCNPILIASADGVKNPGNRGCGHVIAEPECWIHRRIDPRALRRWTTSCLGAGIEALTR